MWAIQWNIDLLSHPVIMPVKCHGILFDVNDYMECSLLFSLGSTVKNSKGSNSTSFTSQNTLAFYCVYEHDIKVHSLWNCQFRYSISRLNSDLFLWTPLIGKNWTIKLWPELQKQTIVKVSKIGRTKKIHDALKNNYSINYFILSSTQFYQ